MSDPTPTKTLPAKEAQKKSKPRNLPPYHVVLLDDNDHSYEYVMEMLKSIFGYDEPKTYTMAKEVDTQGRVIVFTTHKELAELKRDQICSFGEDYRVATCKGSMSAVVEPAEG